MAVRACCDGIIELGERLDRIVAVPHCGFQPSGGIGHSKCADRARRDLSAYAPARLHRRASVARAPIRLTAWAANIASTSCSRTGIAKRHAPEMLEIDRTVIGSERRRWHPVNPLQMIRHGDNHNLSAPSIRQRGSRQPIMEVVNGTFA